MQSEREKRERESVTREIKGEMVYVCVCAMGKPDDMR